MFFIFFLLVKKNLIYKIFLVEKKLFVIYILLKDVVEIVMLKFLGIFEIEFWSLLRLSWNNKCGYWVCGYK